MSARRAKISHGRTPVRGAPMRWKREPFALAAAAGSQTGQSQQAQRGGGRLRYKLAGLGDGYCRYQFSRGVRVAIRVVGQVGEVVAAHHIVIRNGGELNLAVLCGREGDVAISAGIGIVHIGNPEAQRDGSLRRCGFRQGVGIAYRIGGGFAIAVTPAVDVEHKAAITGADIEAELVVPAADIVQICSGTGFSGKEGKRIALHKGIRGAGKAHREGEALTILNSGIAQIGKIKGTALGEAVCYLTGSCAAGCPYGSGGGLYSHGNTGKRKESQYCGFHIGV